MNSSNKTSFPSSTTTIRSPGSRHLGLRAQEQRDLGQGSSGPDGNVKKLPIGTEEVGRPGSPPLGKAHQPASMQAVAASGIVRSAPASRLGSRPEIPPPYDWLFRRITDWL